jgi:ABC-type amino acid transport/signal transduction systems, periplasmic component/domain
MGKVETRSNEWEYQPMIIVKKILFYGMLLFLVAGIWFFFGNKIRESQGFIMAVAAGTPFEIKAHKFSNISEIRLDDDNNQVFNELASGKADVIIADRLTGLSIIKKAGYRDLKPVGDLFEQETIAVAFIPEDGALRQSVSRALTVIIHNGTYARISRRYFGRDILREMKPDFTHPEAKIATDDSWHRIQRSGRIRIAIRCSLPPFIYYDQYNHFAGFDIEIAEAICKELGIRFVPVLPDWETVGEGLLAKRYDGILGITADTFELLNHQVEFTIPFHCSGAQLFVRNDSPVTGPETLQKGRMPTLFSLPKFPKLSDLFFF